MLPRLKNWLDNTLGDGAKARKRREHAEFLSTFMSDDKLFVCESTITDFARTIAKYEGEPAKAALEDARP